MDILAPTVRIPSLGNGLPVRQNAGGSNIETYNPDAIAWATLTLSNGWAVVSGFALPQYRVVPGRRVVVKGVISRTGLLAAGDTITTFPPGFRPKEQRVFVASILGGTIGLGVKPTGELVYAGLSNLTGATQLSLDSVEFDAEQ